MPSICWIISNKILTLSCLLIAGFPLNPLFQHDSPGKHCRRRKARTVFSDQQLNGLEKRFEAQRYLSTPERVELAAQLSLSETQVPLYSFCCKISLVKKIRNV